jgi:putative membrane protein
VSASAKHSHWFFLALFTMFTLFFVWSAINPYDRPTWWLEVLPTIIALPVLLFTYKSFPLTPLVYCLILAHALILLIGGHYTYAEVPFFSWLRDTFDWSRNYYDRLGHFAQGFIPAMIVREILLRKQVVNQSAWLFFIVCSICLSISACYEFIEWWVAVAAGGTAEAFLGTQGDVWDTQWDMLTALIGAFCAQMFLKRRHNQQLAKLERKV